MPEGSTASVHHSSWKRKRSLRSERASGWEIRDLREEESSENWGSEAGRARGSPGGRAGAALPEQG